MTESEWIDQLKQRFSPKQRQPVLSHDRLSHARHVIGIGDDCAVIPIESSSDLESSSRRERLQERQNKKPTEHFEESLLVSTDLLVEGVHFVLDWFSLEELGWKSAAVNLSDIASMGGIPFYIWISIAVPKKMPLKELELFYTGIQTITQQYKVSLLGGDTSKSLDSLFISITVIGKCLSSEILTRSSAKPKDWIYLTGNLGDSSAGLSILKENAKKKSAKKKSAKKNPDLEIQKLIHRHKKPQPRIQEMQKLKKTYQIRSAIDLSDGISSDLAKLTQQSQVGSEIYWEKLPLSAEFKKTVPKKEWETHVLHGGEDYEILFTSPDEIDPMLLDAKYSCKVHKIGQILSEKKNFYIQGEKRKILIPKSYDHFR